MNPKSEPGAVATTISLKGCQKVAGGRSEPQSTGYFRSGQDPVAAET